MYLQTAHFVLAIGALGVMVGATPAGDMSPLLRSIVDAEFRTLTPRATPTDLQTFNGALLGIKASAITNSGDPKRPFEVDGSTFTNFAGAGERSCSNQFNSCANAANAQKGSTNVGDCQSQQSACNAAQSSATQQSFGSFTSSNSEFDFICDA